VFGAFKIYLLVNSVIHSINESHGKYTKTSYFND